MFSSPLKDDVLRKENCFEISPGKGVDKSSNKRDIPDNINHGSKR